MRKLVIVSVVTVALGLLMPLSAGAVDSTPTGVYPAWSLSPSADPTAQVHTGALDFGTLGYPGATFTVSKSIADAEDVELRNGTDAGEWFGVETPFGAVFGPSGPSPSIQFLSTSIDTRTFGVVATTTVQFSSPVPAGVLGFALGDIDVDSVVIDATDETGAVVTGDQLVGNTFNFCDVSSSIPDDCVGLTPPWPVPTWDAATRTVSYPTSDDTDGAVAWFRPTIAVSSLTFTFSGGVRASRPSYRLWFAGLESTVSGTVTFPAGSAPTPVPVSLFAPDGATLATTMTGVDGSFAFDPAVAVSGYTVAITPPEGVAATGGATRRVDLAAGDAIVDFALVSTTVTPKFTG